jgi:ubiquinone/menaquinone biosynthesis C-methylase UbiE
MNQSESYRESHLGKGQDYHSSFSLLPHRRMLWQLERLALDRIFADYVRSESPRHLDFACGTGRVLGHFYQRVGTSVGVDVSASMMEVARSGAPSARFIEEDLTQSDVLADEQFDLITSFRFFPNAEPPLRSQAMAVLVKHLKPGGVMVFNNHMSQESLRYRIAKARGRAMGLGMVDRDVVELVQEASIQVVERVPLAVLPLSDEHMVLPARLAFPLEKLLSRVPGMRTLAQDVIYVCQSRS